MEDDAKKPNSQDALLKELDDILLKTERGIIYKTIVEAIEKPLIEKVLARTFGNQLKAAKLLGINRNTLKVKISKFGIDPEKWKI